MLRRVLPPKARERIYSVELVAKHWADVVGFELARRAEPEALSQGVLTVRVTDATWGKMIYRLQDRIVPELNRAIGMKLVHRINFTKRGRLERPPPVDDKKKKSDVEPEAPPRIVAASEAIADPELRTLVVKSAARYAKAREERRRR